MGKLGFNFRSVRGMFDSLVDKLLYFQPNEDGDVPIRLTIKYGGKTPLVVVVGENASGKSVLRRVMCAALHDAGHDIMHLSIEGRMGYDFNALRSLIYGDEQCQASGVNSARLITSGLENCASRADHTHAIVWDEPEIGLSEGAQIGVGRALADGVPKLPKKTIVAAVITHSKAIAHEVAHLRPHFVFVGEDPVSSLEEWLARSPKVRMPEEIEADGHRRYSLIQAAMKSSKGTRGGTR